MEITLGSLTDGTEFKLNGRRYTKIPLIHTKCDEWGFIANVVYVIPSEDEMIPPTMVIDYFTDDTVIELI